MGSQLQSLIINIKFSGQRFADQHLLDSMIRLEDLLTDLVTTKKIGFLEDNEFRVDSFTLFLKGPDANELFEVVTPLVKTLPPPPGSFMIKRFGDIGAEEELLKF